MVMRKANSITTPLPNQIFRYFQLCMLLLILTPNITKAEGTRQVAPSSTDFVMLETNRIGFGNFAAFDGPEESRLNISIKNPSELVYLGFSSE